MFSAEKAREYTQASRIQRIRQFQRDNTGLLCQIAEHIEKATRVGETQWSTEMMDLTLEQRKGLSEYASYKGYEVMIDSIAPHILFISWG